DGVVQIIEPVSLQDQGCCRKKGLSVASGKHTVLRGHGTPAQGIRDPRGNVNELPVRKQHCKGSTGELVGGLQGIQFVLKFLFQQGHVRGLLGRTEGRIQHKETKDEDTSVFHDRYLQVQQSSKFSCCKSGKRL